MAIARPSLRVFYPVILGAGGPQGSDLDDYWVGWSRSIRRNGGYWRGSFVIPKSTGYNIERLFYTGLGFHFQERFGGQVTWEGLIYEMDMVRGGDKRRRTLDLIYNYVIEYYTDETDTIQISSAVSNSPSITRYGRRELIATTTNQKQAAAEQHAATVLKEHAWPYGRMIGKEASDDYLLVRVCGYIWTANWRYQSVGDGTDDNLSDWISEIVTTDCELLRAGAIASNTLSVPKSTKTPIRALDQIDKLNSLGLSGSPTRYYVYNDRFFSFAQIDTTPSYFEREGMIFPASSAAVNHGITVNPWRIRPGVVRDLDYPVASYGYSGWLEQERDYYLDEITVTDNGPDEPPAVSPGTLIFEESELLAENIRFESLQAQMDKDNA